MARLNVLEYKADFVRGWPHGEAVEMNYPSVDALGNGDIVTISASGEVAKANASSTILGMVARGANDSHNNASGNLYQQVVPNIVLLSNFVVRTSNLGEALVAGTPCFVDANGALVTTGTNVFGTVLEVESNLVDADGVAIANAAVVLVK